MSRGFGSTLGVGATDIITTTYSTAITGQRSYFIWANRNGAGGSNLGILFDKFTSFENFLFTNTAQLQFSVDWSTTAGVWRIPDPGTGSWYNALITYDGSSSSNTPVIYINGTSQTITVQSSPSGSLNTDTHNFDIGNRSGGQDRNWDGVLAWFSIWNGVLLTQTEATSLSQGYLPFQIRPQSLVCCVPLFGFASPELEFNPFGITTMTGTAGQFGPPAKPVTPRWPQFRFTTAPPYMIFPAQRLTINVTGTVQVTATAHTP